MEKWSQFLTFFQIRDDTELYQVLGDTCQTRIKAFSIEEMMSVMLNIRETGNDEVYQEVVASINSELAERLENNYNPIENKQFILEDDVIKILNTMLDIQSMNGEVKDALIEHIEDNIGQFNYETIAELTVVYASKMDDTYKKQFFKLHSTRLLSELEHLKGETMFKIIWSLVHSGRVKVNTEDHNWQLIKGCVAKRKEDLSAKILADLIVLSTKEAEEQEIGSHDLFSIVETDLIKKMNIMTLDDLINLFWSSLNIEKGTDLYY